MLTYCDPEPMIPQETHFYFTLLNNHTINQSLLKILNMVICSVNMNTKQKYKMVNNMT